MLPAASSSEHLPLLPDNELPYDGAPVDPAEAEAKRQSIEKSLLRKLDRRMSILVLIYILNYVSSSCPVTVANLQTQYAHPYQIDRNNAAAARLRGFQEDLSLSDRQFASVLSILYAGYLIMQIPSNMFLNQSGRPSIYLPTCMIIWGLLSVLTGAAQNYEGVLTIRFFLGFVEAAFFPGALFLLSKWYKREELGQRTAVLQCGNLLSNAFGTLIASVILDSMDGVLVYSAWRWLFFVEGALTVAVAVIAIWILPDFPSSPAAWLTPEERAFAQARMKEDAFAADEDTQGAHSQTQGLKLAIMDWRVWWFAMILASIVTSISFNAYFPTLVETFGFSTRTTLLLCSPPWIFAAGACVWISRYSDSIHSRFRPTACSLGVAVLGFLMSIFSRNACIRYMSFFLMAQSYSAFILCMSWVSNTIIRPPNKRAVALALINSCAQFGNILGSYIWPRSWGPSYSSSYTICIIANLIALFMCYFLSGNLSSLNRKLKLEEQAKGQLVPGFRYFT